MGVLKELEEGKPQPKVKVESLLKIRERLNRANKLEHSNIQLSLIDANQLSSILEETLLAYNSTFQVLTEKLADKPENLIKIKQLIEQYTEPFHKILTLLQQIVEELQAGHPNAELEREVLTKLNAKLETTT